MVSKRPETGNYSDTPDIGDVMTVDEYLSSVECGGFIDYDGFGHPVKDGKSDSSINVSPSQKDSCIPLDATHIEWFNR